MEETSEHEQAEAYRKGIEPLWTEPLFDALVDDLPIAPDDSVLIAESRGGYLPIEVRRRLVDGGRVIALDDQRPMLDAARARTDRELSDDIFFVVERAHSISYADDVFDAALCFHGMVTARQIHRVIDELARVTVPEGVIAIAVPLASSFPVFYDLLDEALRRHDLESRLDRIDDVRETLVSPVEIVDVADRVGLDDVTIERLAWDVEFERGRGFLNSPLVRETFFPHWISPVPSHEREPILESIGTAIDAYWEGDAFQTGLEAGVLVGRVGR
jgi:SAM-dependent methyltransferase